MKSTGWLFLGVATIACAGDRALAPRPPDISPARTPAASYEARTQASRSSLVQDEAGLQNFLRHLESDIRSFSGDSDALHRKLKDAEDVRAAVDRVQSQLRALPSTVSRNITSSEPPLYDEGTNLGFVPSGTWLKISPTGDFSASSEFTYPVLLTTTIRGNTSTGWTGSSGDGAGFSAEVLATSQYAFLSTPSDRRDCNATAVSIWGSAEHTAGYRVNFSVGGGSFEARYQVASQESRYPTQTCPHTPLSVDIFSSGGLVVGGTGTISTIWRGSQESIVSDCPSTWNASPSGIVTLAGSGDSRSVTAIGAGTASITAICRGVSASASIAVSPSDGGGNGGGDGGGGNTCSDYSATNYGEVGDCTYPAPGSDPYCDNASGQRCLDIWTSYDNGRTWRLTGVECWGTCTGDAG